MKVNKGLTQIFTFIIANITMAVNTFKWAYNTKAENIDKSGSPHHGRKRHQMMGSQDQGSELRQGRLTSPWLQTPSKDGLTTPWQRTLHLYLTKIC